MGWNIFPLWAGIVMLIAATASIWAVMKKERSTVAIATMLAAILAMGGFIILLPHFSCTAHSLLPHKSGNAKINIISHVFKK